MRSLMLLVAGLALIAGVVVFASTQAEEATKTEADPFVGNYLKFGRWEPRKGQFGESPHIAITKEGDTYRLSKPYDSWKFKLKEKGTIADAPGGIGSIIAGEVKYVDGYKVRVLRAEFCYEQFILYDMDAKSSIVEEKKK